MKVKVTKLPWIYRVYVSKDSPKNIKRGFFHDYLDNEYSRGYYHPVTYTELREAQEALAYFEKGFIEKSRTIIKRWWYGREMEEKLEIIKL
jgi:hypothetical protein